MAILEAEWGRTPRQVFETATNQKVLIYDFF